jgi:hypothetical protein
MSMTEPDWAIYGKPYPKIGPLGEAFRAGFYNIYGPARGVPGSLQRKAWVAGRRRSKVQPNLFAQKEHPACHQKISSVG